MFTFKSVAFSAALLVGASTVASAADVYQRDGGGYKDDYMPAMTWTGFYIGANIGSTFDDTVDVSIAGYSLATGEFDDALVGGVQVGYNVQTSSNFVLGLEADIGIQDDEAFGESLTSYVASLRARLGYAFGNALLYGTGGIAIQSYESPFDEILSDETSVGWVAGAGLDYKLASNVSLGVEALYYNFENDVLVFDLERETWTVRARLNYHFGSGYDTLK